MCHRAHSFRFAARFLPPDVRRDVTTVYAYFRSIDDLVDEPNGRTEAEIRAELRYWEALLKGQVSAHGLGAELLRVVENYDIPARYLMMVLEGAQRDLQRTWVETLPELLEYSVLVAGSVGMVMAHLLGNRSPSALRAAEELGVAMQLTNVVRDIGEDLQRGRVYLPKQYMLRAGFGIGEQGLPTKALLNEQWPSVRLVIQQLVREARDRYSRGAKGIVLLDPPCRFAILLAAELYSRILRRVDNLGIEVLSKRAYVGRLEKVEAFIAVSPVWLGTALPIARFGRGRRLGNRPSEIVG